jgi:thioredoxin reductase
VEDFEIPVYFNHKVAKIHGKDRVEKVSVVKVDEKMEELPGTEFAIECDTVLVSVGLIPENELIEMAGVEIDKKTNSPVSKEVNKTSIPGIFVCGNSFKVYDYVDSVTRDSILAGKAAAEYIKKGKQGKRRGMGAW